MEDLQRTKLRRDYLHELKDLYYFYLDEDSRNRLASMGRIRRAFSLVGWLLKSLFLKLSPARRLLLVVAFALTIQGATSTGLEHRTLTIDLHPLGSFLLLIVLMLELRDKLLARDEIEIARQVQLALLPRHHPTVPGWSVWGYSRPANDVGGDLVDYIDVDGFRHGIVLGDVAGKGLGAALLTAKLQATLRALVPDSATLDDLGTRANTIFHRDGLENRYATLFFAMLEHDSGEMRYLNAGHNPPLVVRPDRVEWLPASSYPLGMLIPAAYEEKALHFEPGEMLLAFSDGLTEATNERGEEFGVGRVEALLPELRRLAPEAVGSRVLQEVDQFTGGTRITDDLSLVVIARR